MSGLRVSMDLHRPLSKQEFNPNIDLARALAILPVIAYHVYRALGSSEESSLVWFTHGYRGVYLFFALSGFILYDRFMGKAVTSKLVKRYYLRRLFRLEPPYIFNLLLLLLLSLVGVIPDWRGEIWHFLASLCYSHNLIYGEPSLLNGVLWSLEVEIQFYLICPFLAMILNRFSRIGKVATLIAFILLGVALSIEFDPEQTNMKTLLGYAHYFLIGVLIAVTTKENSKDIKQYAPIVALAIVLYFALSFKLYLSKILELSLVFFILYTLLRCNRIKAGRNNLFVLIGSMVYSIYMYHYLIIIALVRVFNISVDSTFNAVTLVVLAVLLSAPFYILIERPTMKRGWEKEAYEYISKRIC